MIKMDFGMKDGISILNQLSIEEIKTIPSPLLEMMIKETLNIANKESLGYQDSSHPKFNVRIVQGAWETNFDHENNEISYGEYCFASLIGKRNRESSSYYIVEKNELLSIHGESKKLLKPELKILSVMLEEMAHAKCKIHSKPHRSYPFISSFKELWLKYADYLYKEIQRGLEGNE